MKATVHIYIHDYQLLVILNRISTHINPQINTTQSHQKGMKGDGFLSQP